MMDFRFIDPAEGIIRCKAGLEIDGASFGRASSGDGLFVAAINTITIFQPEARSVV